MLLQTTKQDEVVAHYKERSWSKYQRSSPA